MTIDPKKDYYAILGVAPTAEDVVIKAAYKALVQRYHPDRASSHEGDTTKKVAEINEAYRVLSNQQTRNEYGELRGAGTQSAEKAFDENEAPKENAEFVEDWRFACEYYPKLFPIEERLRKISWRLALAFQALILETKSFGSAAKIARNMESDFLTTYFGSNKKIIEFAKGLIFSENQEAARELNKAIKILGDSVNPELIIGKIRKKYNMTNSRSLRSGATSYGDVESEYKAKKMLREKGYDVIEREFGWLIIEPLGGRQKISNVEELFQYALSREDHRKA